MQLLHVGGRERLQMLLALGGELQPDDPLVLGVAAAGDQARLLGPVDQADGAVVAEQEVVGHLADRRPARVGVAPDGQQELVLGRRQPGCLGLLLAPAQEAAQAGPERQQVLVVGVRQSHRTHDIIVVRCYGRSAAATPRPRRRSSADSGTGRDRQRCWRLHGRRPTCCASCRSPSSSALLGAGISLALLDMIGFLTNLLYYQRLSVRLVSPDANTLGALAVVIPIGGGLIVGLMARFGSEQIRGHGIPEAMERILINGSRVQPRLAFLKPISSAVSIGTGGPFGAEGPIILTGGAVGSIVGQLFHLTAAQRRVARWSPGPRPG